MKPRVVISGSYHRSPELLSRVFRELETTGCRILSPVTLDFTDPKAAFVRTGGEQDLSDADIERFHLRMLRDANLVWLHAPQGYVGSLVSFELGFAVASRIPIFCFEKLAEAALQPFVRTVHSVFEALDTL